MEWQQDPERERVHRHAGGFDVLHVGLLRQCRIDQPDRYRRRRTAAGYSPGAFSHADRLAADRRLGFLGHADMVINRCDELRCLWQLERRQAYIRYRNYGCVDGELGVRTDVHRPRGICHSVGQRHRGDACRANGVAVSGTQHRDDRCVEHVELVFKQRHELRGQRGLDGHQGDVRFPDVEQPTGDGYLPFDLHGARRPSEPDDHDHSFASGAYAPADNHAACISDDSRLRRHQHTQLVDQQCHELHGVGCMDRRQGAVRIASQRRTDGHVDFHTNVHGCWGPGGADRPGPGHACAFAHCQPYGQPRIGAAREGRPR